MARNLRGAAVPERATLIDREVAALTGEVTWSQFSDTFMRVTRQIVVGRHAAADCEITHRLRRLRQPADWTSLAPVRTERRRRFLAAVERRRVTAVRERLRAPDLARRSSRCEPGTRSVQRRISRVPRPQHRAVDGEPRTRVPLGTENDHIDRRAGARAHATATGHVEPDVAPVHTAVTSTWMTA
jgi:hypothetical protein